MLKDTKKPFTVSAATRADHMTAVRDSLGNPLMYVVNFEQGGFCVVSATKKSFPILAHGDEGFFDLEKVDQSGVCLWLEEMEYGIVHQDTLSEQERISLNSAWREYEKKDESAETRAYGDMNDPRYRAFSDRMGSIMGRDGDAIPLANASATGVVPSGVISSFTYAAGQNGCPIEYAIIERISDNHTETIGPLVKTNWHQGNPYNSACPKINGQAPKAGCVAIAMAQLMNHHQHSAKYFPWARIAGGNSAEIANLIADIGLYVGMVYGLNNSSATDERALAALNGRYGYNARLLYRASSSEPISEIAYRRPYYIGGYKDHQKNGGHAWIVDGTETYFTNAIFKLHYQINSDGQYNSGYDYHYASRDPIHQKTHVNWGWETANAWYTAGSHTQAYSYHNTYMTLTPR